MNRDNKPHVKRGAKYEDSGPIGVPASDMRGYEIQSGKLSVEFTSGLVVGFGGPILRSRATSEGKP